MTCDTHITWENLLRSVVQIVSEAPLCAAIKVDDLGFASDLIPCDAAPVLTQYALAVDQIPDGVVSLEYSQGPFTPLDCDEIATRSLEELALSVIFQKDGGGNIISVIESDQLIDGSCDRECDEEGISTIEMVRRSFVEGGQTRRVLIHLQGAGDYLTCDTAAYPFDALVRAALIPLPSGAYAWRVNNTP